MNKTFLAQESKNVNEMVRKRMLRCSILIIILILFIYFLGRDIFDTNKSSGKEIVYCFTGLIVIVIVANVISLIKTSRVALHGENLILPFQEGTKEEIAEIINQEVENGVLVEEYIDEFLEGKTPSGERIILTASYLLICGDKVTAIPREKIYWLCAQVGTKGGPYRVRLLIFTEKKLFKVVGVDIEHAQMLADKLYQYIPNIFHEYDTFTVSYQLEEIYQNNKRDFLQIYNEVKNTATKNHD